MGGGGLLVGGLRKQNLDFAILKFGGFVGFVLIAHRIWAGPFLRFRIFSSRNPAKPSKQQIVSVLPLN